MPDNEMWRSGPSALWVMAGAQGTPGRVNHVAMPLPVAVTAAGLVSGVRLGAEALRRSPPQVAQWEAIRSYYRDVAEWIDDDASGLAAPAATDDRPTGRMSCAGVADYLGLLDHSDDVNRWLSTKPDYWVSAGASVDAAARAVPKFRRNYRLAAVIGPITVYRRGAIASQA